MDSPQYLRHFLHLTINGIADQALPVYELTEKDYQHLAAEEDIDILRLFTQVSPTPPPQPPQDIAHRGSIQLTSDADYEALFWPD